MKNIIFIAPPAAGKGTVSDYLVKNYNYKHLSTGDLLREEIAKGTLLGQEIDSKISKGSFVPDELIIRLVQEQLETNLKDKLFILDGFPRTLNQACKLDEMLVSLGVTNNVVIYLEIDKEAATARVLGRMICPKCKRSYNLDNEKLKPVVNNQCDDCKVKLEHRSDDTKETFEVRFDTYLENTSPIIEYYKSKDMLVSIKATQELNSIFEEVVANAIDTSNELKRLKND